MARMNLLITGPPASGKSTAAMGQFRSSADAYLITPTATMAEHVRHELARSGFSVRPSRVGTLASFLELFSAAIPQAAPEPLLHVTIANALERLNPERFAPIRESRGLHVSLADLIEELPDQPPASALPQDLAEVFQHVRGDLAARGFVLRNRRVYAAAAIVREQHAPVPAHIIFDGFFTLGESELDFVQALANRASVTITLPESPGSNFARRRLEAAGFTVRRLAEQRRASTRTLFSATTPEREAEEIARRILHYSARGREFREIGIILRRRDPFGPLVETTLGRFGIPARSYFADSLTAHPAIAFLAGIVRTLLEGWDNAELLSLLRMPVSGLGATPAGDKFDFELRTKLPGRGPLASCPIPILGTLDSWRTERLDAGGWSDKLKSLRTLIPVPAIPLAPAGRDQVQAWRSTSMALAAFEAAVDTTAATIGSGETLKLSEFWRYVETALSLESLRVDDRRRNVIHIMDVYEARQWQLPVIFVCGLLERVFPQYHRQDPLLPDSLRASLGLPTAALRQQEERFLFEIATTRATEETVLSYSRFNEKGEETIPSLFLEGAPAIACDRPVRPAPSRSAPAPAVSNLNQPAALAHLAKLHRKLSPSSIESFLQCPFQFFARRTLDIRERPPAPRDRLTVLVQGQIMHQALADWARMPLLGAQLLNRAFEEACAGLRIPDSYRTEAVRLELLRYFEAYLGNPGVPLQSNTRIEEEFRFELQPGLTIRGRIDRLDTGRSDKTIVIDYKYSPGSKMRELVQESQQGHRVQAGLYMLAAERALKLEPAGMLYCGLKKDSTWDGWHLTMPGLEGVGTSCLPDTLRELMDSAARSASDAHHAITSGVIAVKPRDSKKCEWCDYRDACRVETIEREVRARAAGQQSPIVDSESHF